MEKGEKGAIVVVVVVLLMDGRVEGWKIRS